MMSGQTELLQPPTNEAVSGEDSLGHTVAGVVGSDTDLNGTTVVMQGIVQSSGNGSKPIAEVLLQSSANEAVSGVDSLGHTVAGVVGSDTDLNGTTVVTQGIVQSEGNDSKPIAENDDLTGSTKNANRKQGIVKRHKVGKEAAAVQRAKKQPRKMFGKKEEATVLQVRKHKTSRGRVKLENTYIGDAHKRRTVFSKRKNGLIKKAKQLATLTGTQVVVLLVAETGRSYHWGTSKLHPVVTGTEGKALIETCLHSTDLPPQYETGDRMITSVFKKEMSESELFLERSFNTFNNRASLRPVTANSGSVKPTVPKASTTTKQGTPSAARQLVPILPAGAPCPPDTPILSQAQLQQLLEQYQTQGQSVHQALSQTQGQPIQQHFQVLEPHHIYDQQQQIFLYPAQALPYGHYIQAPLDQMYTPQAQDMDIAAPQGNSMADIPFLYSDDFRQLEMANSDAVAI